MASLLIIGCAIVGWLLVMFMDLLCGPKAHFPNGAYLMGIIAGALISASFVL